VLSIGFGVSLLDIFQFEGRKIYIPRLIMSLLFIPVTHSKICILLRTWYNWFA
jgi:hypothetical protein